MRYSAPFGTPQPPLGTYPRFINGNPVTGTEGSIPPATAIDEDQIEIVTVIQNTHELTGDMTLIPSHADLTQLWRSLMLLIARKYITTPIYKTVHGTDADFPNLHIALIWLSEYTITPTGFVTFMVRPGRWEYTATVELDHPQGHRVVIQGGALLGATPQPGNMQATGYFAAADGTQHINYLRSVHATELSFTGGVNGFYILRPDFTLRYLLISGSQTVAPSIGNVEQGNGLFCLSNLNLDGISIWGFGANGLHVFSAAITCVTGLTFAVSYCGGQGMYVINGAYWGPPGPNQYTVLASNRVSGGSGYACFLWLGEAHIKGNASPGFGNGGIHAQAGTLIALNRNGRVHMNSGSAGMFINGSSTFVGNYCSYTNNQGFGLTMQGNGTAWANYSSFSGNGSGSVHAGSSAYVEVIGSGLAAGSLGVTAPPLNTQTIDGTFIRS